VTGAGSNPEPNASETFTRPHVDASRPICFPNASRDILYFAAAGVLVIIGHPLCKSVLIVSDTVREVVRARRAGPSLSGREAVDLELRQMRRLNLC
jgi:hypothetical protein